MFLYRSVFLIFIILSFAIHAAPNKSLGKNNPFDLNELPAGRLQSQILSLPLPAQQQAIKWLHKFNFNESDLPYIHSDTKGGIFFVDPVIESSPAESPSVSSSTISFDDAFNLNSKPNAAHTVYLDMDGHTVVDTAWNGNRGPLVMAPYSQSSHPDPSFNQAELNAIAETWKRISEDFSPFDINVTTKEPVGLGIDPQIGHILVTYKASTNGEGDIYNCSCGGVAYVGVWGLSNYANYQPALVFVDGVGSGSHNISEAASHELGHNLNLSHDGINGSSYYSGHGSGNTYWAPIMGVGYSAEVTQWSKGEYQGSTQTQDDLSIIQSYLDYRLDDHETANFNTATILTITNNTQVIVTNPANDFNNLNSENKGIIHNRTDVDLFQFDIGSGLIDLTIAPAWIGIFQSQSNRGMNIDIKASLYDAQGSFILSDDQLNDTYANINTSLSAGRYYLAVEGVGFANAFDNTGYSDYASIGQYFINGVLPDAIIKTIAPESPINVLANNPVDSNTINLTWEDPIAIPESSEDGYRILRQYEGGGFELISSLAANSTSFSDTELQNGDYVYKVEAYNDIGSNQSPQTSLINISQPSYYYTSSETTIFGSVLSGSYINIIALSGEETLIENHTGGRPNRRISSLEHIWQVESLPVNSLISLAVNASAPSSNENEGFSFSYSLNGIDFVEEQIIEANNTQAWLNWQFITEQSGLLFIKVTDTDRTPGNGNTDQVAISQIQVAADNDISDTPPQISINSPINDQEFSSDAIITFTAQATDFEDGDLAQLITWSSSIDANFAMGNDIALNTLSQGMHTISASITDSQGNTAIDSIMITVLESIDTIPPVITLLGENSIEITQGQDYLDAGATAFDNMDGDISDNIEVTNLNFDTSVIGIHYVTYTVTDNSNNQAQIIREVNVIESSGNLSIINISQNSFSIPSTNNITITGTSFAEGMNISLVNGTGGPTPTIQITEVINVQEINVKIVISNGGPKKVRTWDISLSNQLQTIICSACINITP